MKRMFWVLAGLLVCSACKWVTVRVAEEGEPVRIVKVPFSVIRTAIRFNGGEGLEIDDLAGVDAVIDLDSLARAVREDGQGARLEMVQDGSQITAVIESEVFAIDIRQEDDEAEVHVRLPIALLELVAGVEDGVVRPNEFLRAMKKHKGLLVESIDRGSHVQIILK